MVISVVSSYEKSSTLYSLNYLVQHTYKKLTTNRLHKIKDCHTIYLLHAISKREHCLDGTHRLEEPVSKMTVKVCGGVPMVISP